MAGRNVMRVGARRLQGNSSTMSSMLLKASTSKPALTLLLQRSYHDTHHKRSIDAREEFWLEAAHDIDWFQRPPEHNIISLDKNGIHRWFAG